MADDDVQRGSPYPLGATVTAAGVNFSVFSKHATRIDLLLFDAGDAPAPARTITLDRRRHRTYSYWHVLVRGLGAGQVYAFRVHGPQEPSQGHRFDATKVLLDPYARAITHGDYQRDAARHAGDNCAHAMRAVVVDPAAYDWEGDVPLGRPNTGTIIYEVHVAGFTRDPRSGVAPEQSARRGTYAGFIDKIPYLKQLGVTTVELLPVQHFDEQEAPPGLGLRNYWGYSTVGLCAPHRGFCVGRDPLAPVNEFRDLVKALHRAGIEVILDVVFNHTTEGDHTGPTLSLRGFENRAYYLLDPQDQAVYANYTGCGNTLNANHSVVRRLVMDSLRIFVQELHVDGFRFDLASILSRDQDGQPMQAPPVLWDIETDPALAGTKIIAEAWDAAGLYQVGSFVGHRWAEWNGPFRDDVRKFFAGRWDNTAGPLSARISGSQDIYQKPGREPNRSVNFITCHDGFTLRDLVSYDHKHNIDNGEEERDGSNDNFSWNCGVEGDSDDLIIQALRLRQMKNMLVVLFLSQGTPMLRMGDEVARTQHGNNNTYCQDNLLGWFSWDDVERNADFLRFVQGLVRLNLGHRLFQEETFWTEPGGPEIFWHGVRLNQPDFAPHSHSLAFELLYPEHGEHLHVMLNAFWEPLRFELPALPEGQRFYRVIDTALLPPEDFVDPAQLVTSPGPTGEDGHYLVHSHSAVVLLAR